LQTTDSNQPLTGGTNGSLIGLARPAQYVNSIAFDDFGYGSASDDFDPPTVSITGPAAGATLSNVVPITAVAGDDVGVTRVEFSVDGSLIAALSTGPYACNFDTRSVWDGNHVLTVRAFDAAGNMTAVAETVATQNGLPLPQPVIPAHYSHIRIAELAYSGWPQDATANQLLTNSVDVVVPNAGYIPAINAVAPTTPLLVYTNVSNVYLNLLTDWLSYADAHGLNREDAFFHVAQATSYGGNSPSSQPVRNFWAAAALIPPRT
jgi:hypothetical protein